MTEPQHRPAAVVAMPDPQREARRAMSHLVRTGMRPHDAATTVVNVTLAVQQQLRVVGLNDAPWVTQLWLAACMLQVATTPAQGREEGKGDRPVSEIAAEWATGITRIARERGVIGGAEG